MTKNALARYGTLVIISAVFLVGLWALGQLSYSSQHHEGVNVTHVAAPTQAAPTQTANPSPNENNTPALPANTPIFMPSQLVDSTSGDTTYTSTSPSYTVINFYGEYLSTNGWKITGETTLNGTTTIIAQDSGQTLTVAISGAANNSTIFIIKVS